jgi:hypothetical protein
VLPALLAGYQPRGNICIKPLDVFYAFENDFLYQRFDKFIWLARDPRDSYLSAFEVRYAYNFWFPGRKLRGVDVGLLRRWRIIHQHYFNNTRRWHLLRYEDLVTKPKEMLQKLFSYLEVPFEDVFPFRKFRLLPAGGDPKIQRTSTIHNKSVARYKDQMSKRQQRVFRRFLGKEMHQLGYLR